MSLSGRLWPVRLEHGAVVLRALKRSDEDEWFALRQRNAAWTGPWDATRPGQRVDAQITFRHMVASYDRQGRSGTSLPWAIEYLPDEHERPVLAGQMSVFGIAYGSARWAKAGYWVDQRWAGRGIVPLALAMAGDYLFGTLGLHRLEVAIRPENASSLRVVEKLGMRREALCPRYMHVDGAWRDHYLFAVDADEVGPGGLIGRLDVRL